MVKTGVSCNVCTNGVIAYDGAALGAETFVSFDKKAVSLLAAQGRRSKLLA